MSRAIEIYNNKIRKNINYDVSFSDLKDIISKNNCAYYIITIKQGICEVEDLVNPTGYQGNKRIFFEKLAALYPKLNVKFIFTPHDCIVDWHAGLPLFSICSDIVNKSNEFFAFDFFRDSRDPFAYIAREENSSFKEKDKKCFYSYNAGILSDMNNIAGDEKTKLLLKSEKLKFLKIVPFSIEEEVIKKYKDQGIKTKIRNSTSTWELVDMQYQCRTNFIAEGHSDVSMSRYMNALFNNGNVIRIGRKRFYNVFDLFCDLSDVNLFFADSEVVDEGLIKKAEESLEDDHLIKHKKEFVREIFTEKNIFHTSYEILKSYRDIFGYKLENTKTSRIWFFR